jgi:hypothetical protein
LKGCQDKKESGSRSRFNLELPPMSLALDSWHLERCEPGVRQKLTNFPILKRLAELRVCEPALRFACLKPTAINNRDCKQVSLAEKTRAISPNEAPSGGIDLTEELCSRRYTPPMRLSEIGPGDLQRRRKKNPTFCVIARLGLCLNQEISLAVSD